jgi:hypothetical protein
MTIDIVDLPIKNGGSFHSYVNVHQWVSSVVPCVSAEPQHADSRAGQSSMTSGYDTTCPSSCPRRMASAFNQLPARNLDRRTAAGAQWHFSSGAMTGFIGTWGHGVDGAVYYMAYYGHLPVPHGSISTTWMCPQFLSSATVHNCS